jgi:YD repeat-containing protein
VTKTQQSSSFGQCDIAYTVYDPAGNVVAAICNYDPGANPDPTTAAEAVALYNPAFPDKNRVTTYAYDEMGRRVKTTVNDGAAFKQTSLTFYDALNRVTRTIANYVNQSGGAAESPALWVWSAVRSRWEKSASDLTPISHGADNTQNIISDTLYNARGMVRFQRDTLGNVTLLGYDDAGRLVKTVQNASQPNYNNDYVGASPDPSLGGYLPNSAPDKDIISANQYDSAGNLVKTTDALGNVALTGYDPLNRPVKTVRSASQPSYPITADPDLSGYAPNLDPDKDLIETTEYDALGRVIRTKRLLDNRPVEQWETTLFGYDALGRQVKVIRSASRPNYNLAADPSLSNYSIREDPGSGYRDPHGLRRRRTGDVHRGRAGQPDVAGLRRSGTTDQDRRQCCRCGNR